MLTTKHLKLVYFITKHQNITFIVSMIFEFGTSDLQNGIVLGTCMQIVDILSNRWAWHSQKIIHAKNKNEIFYSLDTEIQIAKYGALHMRRTVMARPLKARYS